MGLPTDVDPIEIRNNVSRHILGPARPIMEVMLRHYKTRRAEHCNSLEAYCEQFISHPRVTVGNLFWIGAILLYNVDFVVITHNKGKAKTYF